MRTFIKYCVMSNRFIILILYINNSIYNATSTLTSNKDPKRILDTAILARPATDIVCPAFSVADGDM